MARIGTGAAVTALLALTLGFGSPHLAAAQADLLGPGAAFLGGGVSGISTGALDDRLEARGYPTFGQTAGALTLGAYRALSSGVTLGAEWHGLIIGDDTHQGREVGLGAGYGTLGVGYLVDVSPRMRLHPRLGVGGGGMGLWIQSPEAEVGFDEALANPEPAPDRDMVLSTGSMVIDLGAGVEFLPGGRGRGPLLGVRFGYIAAPNRSEWQRDNEPTSGEGPSATLAGPYLRFVVGGAWRR